MSRGSQPPLQHLTRRRPSCPSLRIRPYPPWIGQRQRHPRPSRRPLSAAAIPATVTSRPVGARQRHLFDRLPRLALPTGLPALARRESSVKPVPQLTAFPTRQGLAAPASSPWR